MLNRRLIRIKVFQSLYAYLQDETPSMNKAKSYLESSIKGIENNFFSVLLFPIELIHYNRVNKNPQEVRYLPSDQDQVIYENLLFDQVYDQFVQHHEVRKHIERPAHRWQDHQDVLGSVYKDVKHAEELQSYLTTPNPTRETQKQALISLYKYLISDSEKFNAEMEELELMWEDEKGAIERAIIAFIKRILSEKEVEAKGPQESDIEFAIELLEKSVRFGEEFEDMIAEAAVKWDKERIAKTDMVLMTLALTELMHFPYIPVKVTLNEYLDLAKEYSTPQSSKFVNGILDKLVKRMKEDGSLVKKGRGMME